MIMMMETLWELVVDWCWWLHTCTLEVFTFNDQHHHLSFVCVWSGGVTTATAARTARTATTPQHCHHHHHHICVFLSPSIHPSTPFPCFFSNFPNSRTTLLTLPYFFYLPFFVITNSTVIIGANQPPPNGQLSHLPCVPLSSLSSLFACSFSSDGSQWCTKSHKPTKSHHDEHKLQTTP